MALFSKYLRYRKKGEESHPDDVDRFGEPAHVLFISTNFLSFKQKTNITDADGNVVYKARTREISIHDTTTITNAAKEKIAKIEKKIVALSACHRVTMADGTQFEIEHELGHLVHDIANIDDLGWQLRGDVIGLNFELYDEDGAIIAIVGKKLVSVTDRYCIFIYQPELEEELVAVLIALQHTMRDKRKGSKTGAFVGDVLLSGASKRRFPF